MKKKNLIANIVEKPKDNRSILKRISELEISEEEKVDIVEKIIEKKYPDRGWLGIKYDWSLNRRVDQWFDIIPDPSWRTACWLAGRGFGKTRVAAEITRYLAETETAKRIGVVCPTAHDANAVFLYGDSGLFNISPPWALPEHHPTYKKVTWPGKDTVLYLFSAEDPESLRGHQFDWMVLDELAAWNKGKDVWEQVMLVNRLGKHPRAVVTTTPKANDLIKSVVGNIDTWTIRGSTQENSDNIDVRQMVSMFEGTRMGKQELHGEILEDVEGALWKSEWIERNRILIKDPRDSRPLSERLPDFLYIVLAIDPAMTANKNSDETGMCVAAYGIDDKYYILYADSHKETPHEWAKRALALYDEYLVTSIVAETNQGGDLVLQNLTKLRPDISVHGVHAKKGKAESVNSPILTTKGWKTFGELTNDDLVFDDTGNPVSIEVLPIHEAECAKVTFSDGTSNVYAMEHEWRVLYGDAARRFTNSKRESLDTVVRWRKSGNGYFKTQEAYEFAQKEARRLRGEGKSYREIGNIFNFSHATAQRLVQDGLYNNTCTNYVEKTTEEMMREMAEGVVFSIPQPPPLKMSGSSLIDPYLLGLWNADGCVGASVIAQKTPEDTEIIMEELRQRGFDAYLRNDLICIKDMRWFFYKRNKKEIYQDEWMVREEERLDLVRGMLDGDGYRPNNISLRLSQSGYRLQTVLDPISDAMRSLGWYVTVPQYKETHREPSYTIRVTPTVLDCATLPRKQITYVPHSSRYRTIKSIEPVGIQTVRCISVDNESHMYLSGKGLVPTHNSLRAEEVVHLYELNKVKHVGVFPKAEDQMTQFNPISNPDGDDDICLIGETLIATSSGEVPIKNISKGDLVLTRKGYKKVLESSQTSACAKINTVITYNGTIISGTPDHKVFDYSGREIKIKELEKGTKLFKWKQKEKKFLSFKMLNTLDTLMQKIGKIEIISQTEKNICIEKCGNTIMEQFQTAITSITKTKTPLTTIFQILSAYRRQIINSGIPVDVRSGEKEKLTLLTWLQLESLLQSGINQMRDESGTEKRLRLKILERLSILNQFVCHVELRYGQTKEQNFAQTYAELDTIEKTINTLLKNNANFAEAFSLFINTVSDLNEELVPESVVVNYEDKKAPVFNLTVEDKHEYVANGFLVRNCDALVYACKALMEKAMIGSVYNPSVGGVRHKLMNFRAR